MRNFLYYLWDSRRFALSFLLSGGAWTAVSYLGGQDMSITLYGLLLFSFIALYALLSGFPGYLRRLRALREGSLPDPATRVEAAWRQALCEERRKTEEMRREAERDQSESLGYYTLWVHQIKTPISAIRLCLRGETPLERTVLGELIKIERYVEMALGFERLRDIASDTLIQKVKLKEVVHTCAKKYALPIIEKHLRLETGNLDAEVYTDAKWLSFILEQLISNAVKYTEQGGLSIGLEADGRLFVRDTGVGIRESDLPRIFEKGYTGFNGRGDLRASGVGLYMARRAADALSITLEAQSTPGKGTVMRLRFPSEDVFARM